MKLERFIRATDSQGLRCISSVLLLLFAQGALPVPLSVSGSNAPNFTQQQAQSGSKVYKDNCAACHGTELQGSVALSLTGMQFLRRWADGQHALGDLFSLIKERMPKQSPGSLSDAEYLQVTSFILEKNGFQSGEHPMSADSMNTMLIMAASKEASAADNAVPKPASFPGPAVVMDSASSDRPSDQELWANSDDDWLMYNKSFNGQRYSGLREIRVGNASKMAVTCAFQTGEVGSFEAAPVVYDNVMYIVTAWNTYAIDPTTCKMLWMTPYAGSTSAPMNVTRGIALYKGRLFRSTPNCHLLSLDAKTGKILWDVWVADPDEGYWLSGAPVASEGKVFMGEAGADWGADGHIHAFDAQSGRLLWTFNAIPTSSEAGADTWKKGAEHGGGSFWSTFAMARSRDGDVLYAPIGNPAPDFNEALRPGDNLFTNSVVALNPDTGKLLWYVQQVPHDTRDWDTAAAPVLYEADGREYLAAVNKGGYLYIYDRHSHELVARSEISTHINEDKPITTTPMAICPGNVGGAEWNGPAYSPPERMLVTASIDWCGKEWITETRYFKNTAYFGGTFTFDDESTSHGWLRGFDGRTGRQIWQIKTAVPMVGGVTTSAGGLTFTGTTEGEFWAVETRSGKILYRFRTGGSIAGAPSTFRINGHQYVAVPSSGGPSHTPWGGRGAATVFMFAVRSEPAR